VLDRQPRPGIRAKKSQRDRLIRLALPALHSWAEEDRPLRLVERTVAQDDPDPKALAAYGLYLPATNETLLRFVDGRPVSALTTQFLAWCAARLAARGKTALLLPWDNAGWHSSKEVRAWLRDHNRRVKRAGAGVRIVVCQLPSKSPWLNPIEPTWGHGKRRAVEPDRLLTALEVEERACEALGCDYEEHLALPQKVA
jgi:transposase